MSEVKKPVLPSPAPFTLSDLKNQIPSHCFKRSYAKSFSYVLRDLFLAYCVYCLYMCIDLKFDTALTNSQNINNQFNQSKFYFPVLFLQILRNLIFRPLFWFIQGCVLTGVQVLGHECGHGAFCENSTICDAVGMVLHTALLVPYYAQKHTHSIHHQFCCNIEKDEVFVPPSKSEINVDNPIRFTAPFRFLHLIIFLLFGQPLYLFFHTTGHKYPEFQTNHFNPYSMAFGKKQRNGVIASDIALFFVALILQNLTDIYGIEYMWNVYFGPYLVVNGQLVTITQLQHTDDYVPYYRGKEQNWMRGALSTIDRDYGSILNNLFHHINDVHVMHHLFSTMPFYHHVEATKAVLPLIEKYRLVDNKTSVCKALQKVYRDCVFVSDEGNIVYYESPYYAVKQESNSLDYIKKTS